MQIDGEACFLAASKIKLRWHSQATMLCHRQGRYSGLQPTLSAGVSPDSVLPERCEVYEVTIDTATLTASRLKRVGAIEWDGNREMDTLALSTIRRLIDAALPTFDSTVHRCGYNFLEFHKADPDAEGKYTVISSMVESETLCRTFLFPIGGVRAGVFIASRLPDDENDTIDVAADKLLLVSLHHGDVCADLDFPSQIQTCTHYLYCIRVWWWSLAGCKLWRLARCDRVS
jgi:hypothetical protein